MGEFSNNLKFSISHTTRKKRDGEEEGRNYYYVSEEKFLEMIKKDEFIEYNFFNDNYYGTSKAEILKIEKEDKVCLVEVDINGAKKIYNSGIPAFYIGILPPNNSVLRERLNSRGTENLEQINDRLKIAFNEVKELKTANILNSRIVNDNIDTAYEKLKNTFLSFYPDLDGDKSEIVNKIIS